MCRIERTSTGSMTKTNVGPSGTVDTAVIAQDGTWTRHDRRGSTTTYSLGPDPRWGMKLPILASLTTVTPGGLRFDRTHSRSVQLATPDDRLSLLRQTDVVTINGNSYTTIYDHTTQQLTRTSPEGRVRMQEFMEGLNTANITMGLAPMRIEYDGQGRRTRVTQGDRAADYTYTDRGSLHTYTDALGGLWEYETDLVGRVTKITGPDTTATSYESDAAGNLTAVVMPAGGRHSLGFNAMNFLDTYTAPDVGDGALPLRYTYDPTHALQRVDTPDGRSIVWSRDAFGRVRDVTFSRGTITRYYSFLACYANARYGRGQADRSIWGQMRRVSLMPRIQGSRE